MLYQAIAAQRWWSEQPEVEGPNQPKAIGKSTRGQRYENALGMIESWARRKPRTWIEISGEAGRYLDSDPSRNTVTRWAKRREINLKPLRVEA